ncbi:hypothetical protein BKA70DRAFT_1103120 [Coprinopsis sp. MPI-PUGE-AT-0042]|nr:hypothetical protein BKA70DRAFT_1103120 [Coprinopsis sp. MPI-PUGE-AT-0042]
MRRSISELKFDDAELEEDIGTSSLYQPLHSASSQASTTTVSSLTPSISRFEPGSHFRPSKFLGSLEKLSSIPKSSGLSSSTTSLPSSQLPLRSALHPARSHSLPRRSTEGTGRLRRALQHDDIVFEDDVINKLGRWIFGFAVAEFDLDEGPIIRGLYPLWDMSDSEAENIAFSGFPDSVQFDQGSQSHSFRIRDAFKTRNPTRRPSTLDGHIYGFAHFTQKRDSTSKRGYQQTSIILLTQFPYPALFSSLMSILGPMYQSHGLPMLESACHTLAGWCERPDPTPGSTLELGFLGSVLHVEIPHSIDAQQLAETSSFNEKYDPTMHILATSTPFHPPPLLLFEACLPNLWSIWECLVLCEPMLIFGASPAQTSQAIWWLRDLLRPIPLAGDIRPYFTMQDCDHAVLITKLPPKPGLLLGVTNPFFEKSCSHWPHVLSLGKSIPAPLGSSSPALGASAGPTPGWRTKTHKRYISKDRALLKQLEVACKGTDRDRLAASLNLRRHFCSRTTQLITPLARYLNTLIPTPDEVKRARGRGSTDTLRLRPFNTAAFLVSLKTNGSTLPFKSVSRRTEFYERWLRTPAFATWLVQQESIVKTILHESYAKSSTI